MADRKFYLTAGWLFLVFFIPLSMSYYKNYKVFTNGQIVEVMIKSLPKFKGTRHSLMYFELDGNTHSMEASYSDAKGLHVGQNVKIKYLDGYEDFSIFPDDNPLIAPSIVGLLFLFLSGWCFYLAFRKKQFRKSITPLHPKE